MYTYQVTLLGPTCRHQLRRWCRAWAIDHRSSSSGNKEPILHQSDEIWNQVESTFRQRAPTLTLKPSLLQSSQNPSNWGREQLFFDRLKVCWWLMESGLGLIEVGFDRRVFLRDLREACRRRFVTPKGMTLGVFSWVQAFTGLYLVSEQKRKYPGNSLKFG